MVEISPPNPINKIEDLDCYLVGGAVRDELLELEQYDRDWVVIGASPKIMLSLGFQQVGKSFPVFLHPKTQDEYALARREKKTGVGYKGFDIDCSSDVTLEEDLIRRDLTVNAMARKANGTLIDPFHGKRDLEKGILRHVSQHFVEDPLRVLRTARFFARYYSKSFHIHSSTIELMKSIVASGELSHLAVERVWQEVHNALQEVNPSKFFQTLHRIGALDEVLPELTPLCFERPKSMTYSNIFALDKSIDLTQMKRHRFAVLIYCVSRTINQGKSHVQGTDGTTIVRQFCHRLKVSAKYRKLAMAISKYTDKIRLFNQADGRDLLEIIRHTNGIRQKEVLFDFLEASRVALYCVGENRNEVAEYIDAVKQARDLIASIDQASIARKFVGAKLKEEIEKNTNSHTSGISTV